MLWINTDATINLVDITIAVIWSIVAVLAIVAAVAAKNKRTTLATMLLFAAAAFNVAVKALKPKLVPQPNNLYFIILAVIGMVVAVSAILMLTCKNRLSRGLWLTLAVGLTALQIIQLICLPPEFFPAQSEKFIRPMRLLRTITEYAIPIYSAVFLLILFLNRILKTPVTPPLPGTETSDSHAEMPEQNGEERPEDENFVPEIDIARKETENERSDTAQTVSPAPQSIGQPDLKPRKRSMFCKHCGFSAESIYSNCPRCGNEMTEIVVCPNCHTPTHGSFCGNCGTRVKK